MKKLVSALVMLAASASLAAGTNVDLQSARAMAMATAVVANSPDASAVFFNAADIVDGGQSLRLMVGDTAIIPHITFVPQGTNTTYAVTNVVPPFHGYITYGITKDLAVGFGAFSPYGLVVDWPSDFPGRFLTQKSDLKTYFLNPEVAYRLGILKIGAGVQVVRGTVDLVQDLNFGGGQEGSVEIGAGAWGVGGNVGIEAELLPGFLSVGAHYRSRVKLGFDGKAHFSNVPTEFQGSQSGQLHDQSGHATIWLPDTVQMGVSVQPMPNFRINAQVDYFAWQVFNRLTLTFDDPALNRTEIKNWTHAFNYHIGGEYDVSPTISVRAGFMYDPTPSPTETITPDVPDSNRINIGAGVGYHNSGFTADLGYQFIKFLGATTTFPPNPLPGRYDGYVNAVSLTLGYQM